MVRRQADMTMKEQEKARKDSVAKEVELAKIEAQRKEAEAWNALSKKEKRKQERKVHRANSPLKDVGASEELVHDGSHPNGHIDQITARQE